MRDAIALKYLAQKGFEESYYFLNVITFLTSREAIVQYCNMLNDHDNGTLRQIVFVKKIRSTLAKILVSDFLVEDVVDENYMYGQWMGMLIEKKQDNVLRVFSVSKGRNYVPIGNAKDTPQTRQ